MERTPENTALPGYEPWLQACEKASDEAASLGVADLPPAPRLPEIAPDAPVALLCSPHPDDEVITGALPYRLRQEGWRVVNLAITLGSYPARRAARRLELEACCERLGFELRVAGGSGLTAVRLETRRHDPAAWGAMVATLSEAVTEWHPQLVLFPHSGDQHPTHQGVHGLVRQALLRTHRRDSVWCVESEFWAPLSDPNLMVEVARPTLAELIAALRCHEGEVARNPYHLRLPAWMMDNVRRGSELLAGPGSEAAKIRYATLYRTYQWPLGHESEAKMASRVVGAEVSVGEVFRWNAEEPPAPPPILRCLSQAVNGSPRAF